MEVSFFKDIIKNKSIEFRGVALGSDLEEIKAREGDNFRKKNGSLAHYRYSFELGEAEEVSLTYGYLSPDTSGGIKEITLILESFPLVYWNKAEQGNDGAFFRKMQANEIQDYAKSFLKTKAEIIEFYDNLLGPAEVQTKNSQFRKKYQNYELRFWIKDNLRLFLMTYLNDKDYPEGEITYFMKLGLTYA